MNRAVSSRSSRTHNALFICNTVPHSTEPARINTTGPGVGYPHVFGMGFSLFARWQVALVVSKNSHGEDTHLDAPSASVQHYTKLYIAMMSLFDRWRSCSACCGRSSLARSVAQTEPRLSETLACLPMQVRYTQMLTL